MSLRMGKSILASMAVAAIGAVAAPAVAADLSVITSIAGSVGSPLSDADMGGLRGGAGLFGLPAGFSYSVQIGATPPQQILGSPTPVSLNFSSGGTSGKVSTSNTGTPGPVTFPPGLSFSKTTTYSIPHSFTTTFTLH